MTDRQGALGVLGLDSMRRSGRQRSTPSTSASTTIRWSSTNGSRSRPSAQRTDTVDQVLKLAQHPDFVITNPNRLRSLAGMFGANHWAFHSADGRGYAFLADMIIAADKLNPQVAARLVPPLGRWRRFEPKRAAMMREALERIAATPGLSKDVYEQVTKVLA